MLNFLHELCKGAVGSTVVGETEFRVSLAPTKGILKWDLGNHKPAKDCVP